MKKTCANCAKMNQCSLMPASIEVMKYCRWWENKAAYIETSVSDEEKDTLTCRDISPSSGKVD